MPTNRLTDDDDIHTMDVQWYYYFSSQILVEAMPPTHTYSSRVSIVDIPLS
jgi:hypothetical protein